MAEPSLAGVWAKIERAEEHTQLLEREIDAFLAEDPEPISLSIPYLDPESGYYFIYAMGEQAPPLRLGVILGDAVHNVRSALDHLVWQLVLWNGQTPTEGPGGTSFPYAMSKNAWKGAKKGVLRGVADKHRAILNQVQPYKGRDGPENTYTAALQYLSNVDKNQVVHTVLAVLRDPGERILIRVTRGPGEIVVKQFMPFGGFEHGAGLLRFKVEPMTPDTEVDVDGDVPADVAFGERRVRFGYVKNLPQVARVIVREFEADFTS